MLPRLALALLLLSPALSFAFSSSPSGNTTTYSGFTAGSGNIARYAVSTASDGTVLVSSGGRLNVAGGGSIPIQITGTIARPSAAAAIGRFLGKSIPVLGAGVALYELAQELGYSVDNSSGGVPVVSQTSINIGCGAYPQRPNFTACGGEPPTPALPEKYVFTSAGGDRICAQRDQCGGALANGTYYFDVQDGVAAPQTVSSEPRTAQQLADAVAAKSTGWPSSSALAPAIRDAILAGDAFPVENPVVTGPATAPVSTTTTVDPVTGNTTTTVVTISNTYSGPTVTTTTTSTSTVTNTSTGAPVGQPTVTTTATPVTPTTSDPAEAPELAFPCGIAGLPPCAVKVDESQTPSEVSEEEYKPMLDKPKQEQAELLDRAKGDSDKSFFDGFSDLFVTPALAECVPLEIPGDRGSIDPCGTVGGARAIMAYIWALSGLALCLHMVRKAL